MHSGSQEKEGDERKRARGRDRGRESGEEEGEKKREGKRQRNLKREGGGQRARERRAACEREKGRRAKKRRRTRACLWARLRERPADVRLRLELVDLDDSMGANRSGNRERQATGGHGARARSTVPRGTQACHAGNVRCAACVAYATYTRRLVCQKMQRAQNVCVLVRVSLVRVLLVCVCTCVRVRRVWRLGARAGPWVRRAPSRSCARTRPWRIRSRRRRACRSPWWRPWRCARAR
eukprot:2982578-Pleurochrysis_carterae.AAC.3